MYEYSSKETRWTLENEVRVEVTPVHNMLHRDVGVRVWSLTEQIRKKVRSQDTLFLTSLARR